MSIYLMRLAWISTLPISQKFLLLSLTDQANDDGVCWPKVDTLSARCSMNRRTVQRALSDLEDAGFIQRHERLRRSTWYQIAISERGEGLFPVAGKGGNAPPFEGAAENTDKGGTESDQGRHSAALSNPHITPMEPSPPVSPPKGGRTNMRKHVEVGEEIYSAVFEAFWALWPKGKRGVKAKAYEKWKMKRLDEPSQQHSRDRLTEDVIARTAKDRQWKAGFVPHMTTYLNQRGWTADIDETEDNDKQTNFEKSIEASKRGRAIVNELASRSAREEAGF